MTKRERAHFVRELCGNVTKDILAKVGSMPDDWNGIELRQYIADKFRDCVISGMMDRRRLREYRNAVLVENL